MPITESARGPGNPPDAATAAAARRGEILEREAWADLFEAGAGLPAVARRIAARRVGADALAISVPALPLTLFNRVIGAGIDGGPDSPGGSDWLDTLPAFFDRAPPGRWAVQPAPGPHEAAWADRLAARGHRPLPQRIAKMARDLVAWPESGGRAIGPAAGAATGSARSAGTSTGAAMGAAADAPAGALPPALVVDEAGAAEAAVFAAAIVDGMGLPPWFGDWLRALPGRAGWHAYVARRDGAPVAAAALFVRDGGAWLGMATTLPAARRTGAQRALMRRRLADATGLGCTIACTETGEPQPGEPHPSYSNMLGCGFERVATRLSWARPG